MQSPSIIVFILQITESEPTFIAIDNCRYVDKDSWNFLKCAIPQINAAFCFAIRKMTSITYLCQDAKETLNGQENHMTLGELFHYCV